MAGQIIKKGYRKYQIKASLGRGADGKRKYFTKTINGTRRQAEEYLNKVLHEISTGTFVYPSKDFFSDYISDWLENVAKPRVSNKTFRGYEQSVRLYLIPALGNTKLDKVSPDQIQSMYNKMFNNGLSSSTIKNTHAVLNSSLKQAVKWGKLYRNPAEYVDLPKSIKKEMKVLTPKEVMRFLDEATFSRMKPFFSLLLATCIRPGEALGLKWSDVNFGTNKITINRSLSRSGGKWTLVPPKTQKGRRLIPVPKTVMKDLLEHKNNQSKEAKSKSYKDQGFVFATSTGEPFSDRNIVSRYFKPLLKSAGLPDIRLYDLRHTCATLLLSSGENIKVVSERLGHADVALTLNTYTHVLPDMQEEATAKLENLLFATNDEGDE